MQNIWVRVNNKIQMQTVVACEAVTDVIVGHACAPANPKSMKQECPGKKFYFELPEVLREKRAESVRKMAEQAMGYDGIVIKNFDEIGLLLEMAAGTGEDLSDWQIIGDSFLYAYNTSAIAFYRKLLPGIRFILPDELTDREAGGLIQSAEEKGLAEASDFIYKAYGYQPVMITNQCLGRNYSDCRKPLLKFTDEKKNRFFSAASCGQCYSVIFNGQPTNMLDKLNAADGVFTVDGQPFYSVLLDFTLEDGKETEEILKQIQKVLKGEPVRLDQAFTRGHHYKGIE